MSAVPARRPVHATDPELVAAIAAGDLGCLGALFDRHGEDVHRLVARLGITDADVDDVVQSTFLQVVRVAHGYDGRPQARPWLLGIAVKMVQRHRRSMARVARRAIAWAAEPRAANIPSADEAFEAHEGAARARRALERLSSKKREVFVLVVLEGVRGEDAASALGIPVATVWTRLHHARRELRDALSKESS